MKISSKTLLALLFIPGALGYSFDESTTKGDEAIVSVTHEDSRGLRGYSKWAKFGCNRPLSVTIFNPSASDPTDCENNVCGTMRFACPIDFHKSGLAEITYSITGLTPGLHGLHVHESPVGTGGENTCASTGGHWNPQSNNHGSNLDDQRHIGDLGNILADENGSAVGTLKAFVPLKGKLGIRDRAVVVHEGTDDYGLGGDAGSRAVGNAGARPGCGNIFVEDV